MQPSNVVAIGILGQDSHIAEDLFKPQSDSAQYRRFLIVLAFTFPTQFTWCKGSDSKNWFLPCCVIRQEASASVGQTHSVPRVSGSPGNRTSDRHMEKVSLLSTAKWKVAEYFEGGHWFWKPDKRKREKVAHQGLECGSCFSALTAQPCTLSPTQVTIGLLHFSE